MPADIDKSVDSAVAVARENDRHSGDVAYIDVTGLLKITGVGRKMPRLAMDALDLPLEDREVRVPLRREQKNLRRCRDEAVQGSSPARNLNCP